MLDKREIGFAFLHALIFITASSPNLASLWAKSNAVSKDDEVETKETVDT